MMMTKFLILMFIIFRATYHSRHVIVSRDFPSHWCVCINRRTLLDSREQSLSSQQTPGQYDRPMKITAFISRYDLN